jgi:uncharacterized protein YcbK (DUF882 family)
MQLKHFELSEFDSPDEVNSGENMKRQFLIKLDKARDIADIPFAITSGYRTSKHNYEVGGVARSAHTKGCAADIRCQTSRERYLMITALLEAGFTRIGIGEDFLHVDDDDSKAQEVIWDYY